LASSWSSSERGTLLVKALDDREVGEDFDDGPAICGRFPLEEFRREIAE
jgi:hypothetical protein